MYSEVRLRLDPDHTDIQEGVLEVGRAFGC